jgi:hypothetical protein
MTASAVLQQSRSIDLAEYSGRAMPAAPHGLLLYSGSSLEFIWMV